MAGDDGQIGVMPYNTQVQRQVVMMTVQTVKLGGRKFVIVPEKDFRLLQEKAEVVRVQDQGDAAESRRRMKEPGGKTLAEVRKRLSV